MKVLSMIGQPRTKLGGKAARKLIKQGFVPGILYGGKSGQHISIPFYVHAIDLRLLYHEACFVNLKIGNKTYHCILQEKQYHPVSDIPTHLDLLLIVDNRPIVMAIPLELTGTPAGVKSGGVLVKKIRKLNLKALPKDMPNKVTLDISSLKLGANVKVRNIPIAKYTILHNANLPVAVIEVPRALRSKSGQETAVATAEG